MARQFRSPVPGSEPILQSVIIGSCVLSLFASCSAFFDLLSEGSSYRGSHPALLLIPALAFSLLYGLTRTRHYLIAAHSVTLIFFCLGSYALFEWGFFLPQGLFIYVFVIITSGVVIGRSAAISYTALVIITTFALAYIQSHGIAPASLYWLQSVGAMNDALIFSLSYAIITAVACFYSTALLKERNKLEHRVEERTFQLKKAQDEQLAQLYSFAEFGRLAANLVHDLANPLSTISLNLEQISQKERSALVERAIIGVRRIEDCITTVRTQIHEHKSSQNLCIAEVAEEAASIVQENAGRLGVQIKIFIKPDLIVYTSRLKFRQLLVYLLSNSIDACTDVEPNRRRISISGCKKGGDIAIEVKDSGHGIPTEHVDKVFTSCFTTKDPGSGIGFGLSLCKEYVEQDLGGSISVASRLHRGTTFLIRFSAQNEKANALIA